MQNETLHFITNNYSALQPFLNERTRRLWAATEADEIGRGGAALAEKATGITQKTIRKGIRELKNPFPLSPARSRHEGGGRKKCTHHDPTLLQLIDSLIDPVTRGDPESPLRWTCKSIRRLAGGARRERAPHWNHVCSISSPRTRIQLAGES